MAEEPIISKSAHTTALAKELLDDIELSRSKPDAILLKATRLARFTGSSEIQQWLKYEMSGYNDSDSISLKYLAKTGRWIDVNKNTAYWGPLAQQESSIEALSLRLKNTTVPDSTDYYTADKILRSAQTLSQSISAMSAVKSRVLALLHEFVSNVYYEKLFSGLSETIFEQYKTDVDEIISETCGDLLEKIPSIFDRLSEGDDEAVSQALATCRRIIDGFADKIFPPTKDSIEIGGNTLSLGSNHHQNRINAYIHKTISSNSRKKRLRQTLANLYNRISTGVHKDVSIEEARSLFLGLYLFLGEVLTIKN